MHHDALDKVVGVVWQHCFAREEMWHALGAACAYLGDSLIPNMELLNRPWSSLRTQAKAVKINPEAMTAMSHPCHG